MTIKQVSIVTVQFSLRFNDAQMFVNKSMFRTNPARHASFRYMTNNNWSYGICSTVCNMILNTGQVVESERVWRPHRNRFTVYFAIVRKRNGQEFDCVFRDFQWDSLIVYSITLNTLCARNSIDQHQTLRLNRNSTVVNLNVNFRCFIEIKSPMWFPNDTKIKWINPKLSDSAWITL